MSAGISIDIDHRQGSFRLVARFAASAGLTALFGQSGSGKSTLVNIMAGLVRPDRGRVEVGDAVLLDTAQGIDVPPHRRGIGYVFQEGRLFPHLSVRQNLLFGRWFARRGSLPSELGGVVDLLGIGHLLSRRPGTLSGGEKQRVAIGRALLSQPRLLLMDEPLASLDQRRKDEILPYIERLRDGADMPIVYVSHSIAEVARLADTLVILDGGAVAASGPALDLLSSRTTTPLATSREAGAAFDASVSHQDEAFGLTTLTTPAGPLRVPCIALPVGARLRIRILARDVLLSAIRSEGLSALNVIPAIVDSIPVARQADLGPTVEVRVLCAGAALLARITRRSLVDLDLRPGSPVFAVIKSVALEP